MEHDFIVITSNNQIGTAEKISTTISTKILQLLNSAAGRAQLAATMVSPLRTRMHYQGIARKAFLVESLPDGASPIYSEKIDHFLHEEIVISSSNKIGRKLSPLFSRRIVVPTFEISDNPTIKLSDIKSRRFDLIDRYSSPASGGTSV